jgi:hypothetical protein
MGAQVFVHGTTQLYSVDNVTSGIDTVEVSYSKRVAIAVKDNGSSAYNVVAYIVPSSDATPIKVVLASISGGGDYFDHGLSGLHDIGVEVSSGDVSYQVSKSLMIN